MKMSSARASKQAPTRHSCAVAPKSLSGQPYPDLIKGRPERDFGAAIQLCQVGARFEALDDLNIMAPSEFFGIFFCNPNQAI